MLEIGQVAVILGVDEVLDVRMVAAQHAHLGDRGGTGADSHGFAGERSEVRVHVAKTGPEARDCVP